jgi:apolipoprotein N-acyltransferase
MVFATDNRLAALLAFVSTAIMLWFGTGLNPCWPLFWFAPLPALIFALHCSWWSAALVAAASWLIGGLNLWHYLHVLHVPPSVWLIVFSIEAIIFTAAVSLFRVLLLRGAVWSALLAFPALWVSCEYVNNLTSIHGTGGSLSYTQLKFLPFLQLASITGPWGMTFLLLMFPAALAVSLHLRNTHPKQALRIVATTVSVIVLVLVFGTVRLAIPAPSQHVKAGQVKVGLIASDLAANADVTSEGADTDRLFHAYAGEAETLAAAGAQAIVLPEKLGVVTDADTNRTDALFQSLADKTKATIVVGLVRVSLPFKYNQTRVYAPGAAVLTYDKQHMLPPFESDLKPGTTLTVLPRPSQTWGVAICKDMDFTPLSRQYGQAGVGLMLVPAWDFNLDRLWHGHMAIMRGVEDGFSIARSAKDGYLTVSDNRGRVLAETQSDSAPFATLLAKVPANHDTTLYLLLGDWFAWFAIATLLFTLTEFFRPRRPRV